MSAIRMDVDIPLRRTKCIDCDDGNGSSCRQDSLIAKWSIEKTDVNLIGANCSFKKHSSVDK